MHPRIVVEASGRGVEVITVKVAPGGRQEGMHLLKESLAAIEELGRAAAKAVPTSSGRQARG